MLLQVEPADVIIVEGILVLYMEELREQCNMKIYVDTGTDSPPSGPRQTDLYLSSIGSNMCSMHEVC